MATARPTDDHQDEAIRRLITAAGGKPPTDDQRESVGRLKNAAVDLGALIEALVPPGHDKDLAWIALEDALMRSNRGIFMANGA